MLRGKRLVFMAVAAGLVLGAGVAYATIPDESGVIHGCYLKGRLGVLRVVEDSTTECSRFETPLTWNQQGPKGDPGPPGPPGGGTGHLFAAVNADGTIGSSRGVVLGPGTGKTGTGIYSIQFNRDIDQCVALAGLAIPFNSPAGAVPVGYTTTSFASFTQIGVVTFNASGRAADAPFALAVVC